MMQPPKETTFLEIFLLRQVCKQMSLLTGNLASVFYNKAVYYNFFSGQVAVNPSKLVEFRKLEVTGISFCGELRL